MDDWCTYFIIIVIYLSLHTYILFVLLLFTHGSRDNVWTSNRFSRLSNWYKHTIRMMELSAIWVCGGLLIVQTAKLSYTWQRWVISKLWQRCGSTMSEIQSLELYLYFELRQKPASLKMSQSNVLKHGGSTLFGRCSLNWFVPICVLSHFVILVKSERFADKNSRWYFQSDVTYVHVGEEQFRVGLLGTLRWPLSDFRLIV